MPIAGDVVAYYAGSTPALAVYAGSVKVWPTIVPPVLSTISPTSMLHFDAAKTLTATGSAFVPGSLLQIKPSGGSWATLGGSTVVSETQMTASIDKSPGVYQVSVVNPAGLRSNELTFTGQNNTPTLSAISPTAMHTSDAAQRLTVTGTYFDTGMTIYLLPPGGAWIAKTAVVTSSTQAYCDGVDPSSSQGGVWKVMCGYDVPNVTRSAQKDLTVQTGAVINTVEPTTIARGQTFTMIMRGYGLSPSVMISMGPGTTDQGIGYWVSVINDTEVRLDDHWFGVLDPTGPWQVTLRSGSASDSPVLASKTNAITVT